jgi:acyl carrier protein
MVTGKVKNWVNGVSDNRDAISRIREFVLQKFPLARKRKVTNHDNLLESGVIDSLGVLDLVSFLQEEFSVAVEDDDLTPENFQNIERMAQFVERSPARPGPVE